jgi:hypothetical protein
MRGPFLWLVAAALCALACDTSEAPPTRPVSGPDASSLIPVAPAPQPTPTIPAIPGGDVASSCGEPTPPAVSRINVKVHSRLSNRVLLDSTPLVGPEVEYCRAIGFTDGRAFCPVRPEGAPDRQACEALRVGQASDTGRFGPTWSANGRPCNGPEAGASCLNHPENQYQVFAYGQGTFTACTESSICGRLELR